MDWFQVDKDGLAKLLKQRGPGFMVYELWQNAVDEKTTRINIELRKPPNSQYAILSVEDDNPDGFRELRDAWVLFAESMKKGDPTKRGWMNLGEKLVLACCRTAQIETTTGGVYFDGKGRRSSSRSCRDAGSKFTGELKLTWEEVGELGLAAKRLISPPGVDTYFNGVKLEFRRPTGTEEATLDTRVANADGEMVRSRRKTIVEIYEVEAGRPGWIYEMGIPVVETGDLYDVNVLQKVPLNSDRDNVTPGFLREVRTVVLNGMANKLTPLEATEKWVREAASSPEVEPAAFVKVMDLRFGAKRVGADPSDKEGENIAKSKGYVVVTGGSLTPGEWDNARRTEAIKPAGQVTPSPKPFSDGGVPLVYMTEDKFTPAMTWFQKLALRTCLLLTGKVATVLFTNTPTWGFSGTWSRNDSTLIVNVGRLGYLWFEGGIADIVDFLVHELAHDHGHHLEESYHKACTKFAGILVWQALDSPSFFA